MKERDCIRCQHPVLLEDGHLVYCSHCGAPQIFLSEQLQAEMTETVRAFNERGTPAPAELNASAEGDEPAPAGWNPLRSRSRDTAGNPWTLGVRYALLSGGVALALGLLSLVLPAADLLVLLWVVSAPILTVAFFNGHSGATPPNSSGFGARLGLLTGLLVALCCLLTITLSLVLSRYLRHDAALLDAQLAASFAQQREMVLARMGAEAKPTVDMFAIPEFRVGVLLTVAATSTGIYLVLSTLAGGVAGLLLRRRA